MSIDKNLAKSSSIANFCLGLLLMILLMALGNFSAFAAGELLDPSSAPPVSDTTNDVPPPDAPPSEDLSLTAVQPTDLEAEANTPEDKQKKLEEQGIKAKMKNFGQKLVTDLNNTIPDGLSDIPLTVSRHLEPFTPPMPVENEIVGAFFTEDELNEIQPAITNIDLLFDSTYNQIRLRDIQEYINLHNRDLILLTQHYEQLAAEYKDVQENFGNHGPLRPKGPIYLAEVEEKLQLNLLAQRNKEAHLLLAKQMIQMGLNVLNQTFTVTQIKQEINRINDNYIDAHKQIIAEYQKKKRELEEQDNFLIEQFKNGTLPAENMEALQQAKKRQNERDTLQQIKQAKMFRDKLNSAYQYRNELAGETAMLQAQAQVHKEEGEKEKAQEKAAMGKEVMQNLVDQEKQIQEEENNLRAIIKQQKQNYMPITEQEVKANITLDRSNKLEIERRIEYLQSQQESAFNNNDTNQLLGINREINRALKELKATQAKIDFAQSALNSRTLPTRQEFENVRSYIEELSYVISINDDLSEKLGLVHAPDPAPEPPPETLDEKLRHFPNLAKTIKATRLRDKIIQQKAKEKGPMFLAVRQAFLNDPKLIGSYPNVAEAIDPNLAAAATGKPLPASIDAIRQAYSNMQKGETPEQPAIQPYQMSQEVADIIIQDLDEIDRVE